MESIPRPLKPYFQPQPSNRPRLSIQTVEQSGKDVVIEAEAPFVRGQQFRVWDRDGNQTRAILTETLTGSRYRVKLRRQLTASEVAPFSSAPFSREPIPRSILPLEECGGLWVGCQVSRHQPGAIGWTLRRYNPQLESEQPILQGNDFRSPTVCYFQGSGVWEAGRYKLTATLYDLDSGAPLKSASTDWSLAEPTARLESGKEGVLSSQLNLLL